jgi:hypothetical protein
MVKRNAEGADRGEGGNGIDKAGWYHFIVEEAKEGNTSADLKATVIGGDNADQKGKSLNHFVNFFASDASDEKKQQTVTRMMFDWAEALMLQEKVSGKIFTAEVRKQLVESSADVEFDFNEAMGRQFVAKVELEPYKGKDEAKKVKYAGRMFPRIGFDVYSPLHDAVKNVPKDPEYMSYLGVKSAGGGNNGGAAASPAKTTPKPPAPIDATATTMAATAAAADPWGGF